MKLCLSNRRALLLAGTVGAFVLAISRRSIAVAVMH
jgi:hypothetical protein